LTKANVLQLGLLLFLLGVVGYGFFVFIGFDTEKAGIASESILLLIVLGWIFSYFFRVITGNMTFIEQRKRYRHVYDQLTDRKLQEKFDSMSNDQKISLLKELETDKNKTKETT